MPGDGSLGARACREEQLDGAAVQVPPPGTRPADDGPDGCGWQVWIGGNRPKRGNREGVARFQVAVVQREVAQSANGEELIWSYGHSST